MQLDKYKAKTKRVTIEIDGDELTLTVRPYVMTPERERAFVEAEALERYDELLAYFVDYVADWDLEIAEGEPCPITVEAISEHVPSQLLMWIMQKAQSAASPLDETPKRKSKR